MAQEQKPVREDHMDDQNPNEIGVNHPAKDLKTRDKVDIKESELGRESTQTPADEHIEHRMSQIDEGTKKMHAERSEKELGEPMESDSDTAEGRDNAGYINDKGALDDKNDEERG